jgi:hypothetical protein
MNPRDSFIVSMRLPSSAAIALSAPQLPPDANAPEASGGLPLTCAHMFCGEPATDGDLCAPHAELMADIRAEYEHLSADFEEGWE